MRLSVHFHSSAASVRCTRCVTTISNFDCHNRFVGLRQAETASFQKSMRKQEFPRFSLPSGCPCAGVSCRPAKRSEYPSFWRTRAPAAANAAGRRQRTRSVQRPRAASGSLTARLSSSWRPLALIEPLPVRIGVPGSRPDGPGVCALPPARPGIPASLAGAGRAAVGGAVDRPPHPVSTSATPTRASSHHRVFRFGAIGPLLQISPLGALRTRPDLSWRQAAPLSLAYCGVAARSRPCTPIAGCASVVRADFGEDAFACTAPAVYGMAWLPQTARNICACV